MESRGILDAKLMSDKGLISNTYKELLQFNNPPNNMVVLCLVTQSCLTLCDPMDCSLLSSSVSGDSPGKNTGVGCHALFQGIFPTQGSNPGLPHCRWILYHLSHKASPRILEWVVMPSSRRSSWPRNQTGVSCIAGGFFTIWATRDAPVAQMVNKIKINSLKK